MDEGLVSILHMFGPRSRGLLLPPLHVMPSAHPRHHTTGAPQIKGHRGGEMCVVNKLKGGLQSDRKGVYRMRANPRKILSPHKKNRELFQGLYSRVHWNKQNHRSWWASKGCRLQHTTVDLCISSNCRCLGKNGSARAQTHKCHRRRRLVSTYNGIPSRLLQAKQHH
jgi:hypothetical protein